MGKTEIIFNVQMAMGVLWMSLVARWYVLPKLYTLPFHNALVPLLLVAVLRFHGLNFMVPENNNALSEAFAVPAGYGDFAVCLIALSAAIACRMRSSVGPMLAWLYAVVGTLDFMMGFYLGDAAKMPYHLGATWFMVIQEAPLQILALFCLFRVLLKHPQKRAAAVPAAVKT